MKDIQDKVIGSPGYTNKIDSWVQIAKFESQIINCHRNLPAPYVKVDERLRGEVPLGIDLPILVHHLFVNFNSDPILGREVQPDKILSEVKLHEIIVGEDLKTLGPKRIG